MIYSNSVDIGYAVGGINLFIIVQVWQIGYSYPRITYVEANIVVGDKASIYK